MTEQTFAINKEPWLAVLLSTLFPGIGQIYAGKVLRGAILIFITLSLLSIIAWLILSSTGSIKLGFQLLIVYFLLSIFNLFDAHRCTKRGNNSEFERLRKSDKDPWLAVFLSRIIPGLGHLYQGKWLFAFLFFISIFITDSLTQNFLVAYPINLGLSYLCLYHVYIYSPTQRTKSQPLILKVCLILLLFELLVVLFALSVRIFVAEARYIPSSAMIPTLQINDRFIVNKLEYRFKNPQRKDIIVFNPTETLQKQNYHEAFIKRIVGLPGENLEIKAGKVYINARPLQEDYIFEPPKYQSVLIKIPSDSYFVLGDNRNNSFDSHIWGFVPRDRIIGKATKIFLPYQRSGIIK
jgi:signal peptidase I